MNLNWLNLDEENFSKLNKSVGIFRFSENEVNFIEIFVNLSLSNYFVKY